MAVGKSVVVIIALLFESSVYGQNFVNDSAVILNASEKTELNQKLVDYYNKTNILINIGIIKESLPKDEGDSKFKLFTRILTNNKLFTDTVGNSNVIKLMLSTKDKKLHVFVNGDICDIISSKEFNSLTDQILIPHLSKDDYFGGFDELIDSVESKINVQSKKELEEKIASTHSHMFNILLVLLAILVACISLDVMFGLGITRFVLSLILSGGDSDGGGFSGGGGDFGGGGSSGSW